MKKIIVILVVLVSLVVVNMLINKNSSDTKNDYPTLSEAIGKNEAFLSTLEIINNNSKIKFLKKDSCYVIESINYCADSKKINSLKKFFNNNIKDIYVKNEKNLRRLGFLDEEDNLNLSAFVITIGYEILHIGNINEYGEAYVLHADKIYKVDYYKGLSDISTNKWIDKSEPIITILDSDKFDVEISRIGKPGCIIKHEKMLSHSEYSTLRNSFFDLYANDVVKLDEFEYLDTLSKAISIKLHHQGKKKIFDIWKEDHLIYMFVIGDGMDNAYIIPNAVYENIINVNCKLL